MLLLPATKLAACSSSLGAPPISRLVAGTSRAAAAGQRRVRHAHARRPAVLASAVSESAAPTPAAMDPNVENTVEKIHCTPSKIVLFLTGGAAQAPAWLLSVPGASRTVLEVRVPYATAALSDTLGHAPEAYASAETAAEMARAALRHAANLAPLGTDILGVGCACALATNRARQGDHKAFIATVGPSGERSYALQLAKGARDRLGEDSLVSRLLVRAVADATGVGGGRIALGLHEGGPSPEVLHQSSAPALDAGDALAGLVGGRYSMVEFSGGGALTDAPRRRRVYLPGSFNPLHDGHKDLLAAAARLKPGMEGCFELSIGNADKGQLPLPEIQRRVAQFAAANLPVVVTQAPLFTQKADLFQESVFVVGYDTAVRLVRPEYYGDETAMLLQFAKLRHEGCSFLVAGRRDDATGRFLTLADMPVPEVLQRGGLFEAIPETEFRADISSTQLRESGMGI